MTAKNIEFAVQTRIALLEQTNMHIYKTLERIENNTMEIQLSIKEIRKDAKSDSRWLLTIIGGLGFVMAHGFHWF